MNSKSLVSGSVDSGAYTGEISAPMLAGLATWAAVMGRIPMFAGAAVNTAAGMGSTAVNMRSAELLTPPSSVTTMRAVDHEAASPDAAAPAEAPRAT